MTDNELAGLETQLAAKLNWIAALNKEAKEMAEEAAEIAEQIIAERERRRSPATVHELRP